MEWSLLLNVPRIDSFASQALGARWPLLLAEHLNYFTVYSLRVCGRKAGLELVHHGQRAAAFSLSYVLYRAGQHGIPGAARARALVEDSSMARLSIPVWLGEVYAVFRKTSATRPSQQTAKDRANTAAR